MKYPQLILIAALLTAFVSCKSGQGGKDGEKMNLDPRVEALIGGQDVYDAPQRVVPVLVNQEPGSGEKSENLEGYAIENKGKLLSPEQIKRLQAVIFNAATYDFNVQKRCVFNPYIGFIFEKSGKQAHALFCFSCDEVSFGREGKQGNLEDFDPARKEILALARELFPRDARLAGMKDKK